MIVVGLTGSIGMGKSTAAAMFRRLGIAVYDADGTVHRLFARGGEAVAAIERAFPGVVREGAIDRGRLGARVFGDDAALARLEAIVHPLVFRQRAAFLGRQRRRRAPVVVLDIPLLFETGADRLCDLVVVVSAPRFLQTQRMLHRPGMTRQRLAAIRARQTDDGEKRRRADLVIPSGNGKAVTWRAIRRLVGELMAQRDVGGGKPRHRRGLRRRR
ncbi:MAG: dephospho-CoA kinase [Rhodospirillales bacterium]